MELEVVGNIYRGECRRCILFCQSVVSVGGIGGLVAVYSLQNKKIKG